MAVLTRTRNPCQLARAIYLAPELVPHTLLSASEPENVGTKLGIETVDPSYFFTEGRWLEHRRGLGLPDTPYPDGQSPSENPFENLDGLPKGTVGAVALDIRGCIASVTSTGGMTNKMVGRIGDTPHIGAGPWAEEWTETRWFRKLLKKITRKSIHQAVGISCTGDGDVCTSNFGFPPR
jgi:L-asparaginase / beta-aspartyl-peptidase